MRNQFRAWNKEYEFMMEPVMVSACGTKCKYDSDWWETDNIILMQCTGAKDKNRKEIYDGDILEYICGGHAFHMAVNYNEHTASYVLDDTFSLQNALIQGACIIGNIYENPELSNKNSKS